MPKNIPAPPIPMPDVNNPIVVPPEPSQPIEIEEPPQSKPNFPIRDPGVQPPSQLMRVDMVGARN